MEDDRSTPSSTMSSHDEQDCDSRANSPEVKMPLYPPHFSPLWFPYTPLHSSPIFNPSTSLLVPLAPPRSVTPSIRHNFKSIDELISSSPTPLSLLSTSSHRNDDTGYSSLLLSASLLSSRHSRESVYSVDDDDEEEIENIKPSSPIKSKNNKKNDDSKKTKKLRTAFTDHQKLNLDRFYATNRYPDPTQMETLSRLLSLEEKVIRVWFQNKRSREKNHPKNDHLFASPAVVPTQNHPHLQTSTSMAMHSNAAAAMAMWHQFASSPNFSR